MFDSYQIANCYLFIGCRENEKRPKLETSETLMDHFLDQDGNMRYQINILLCKIVTFYHRRPKCLVTDKVESES
jgi:hypothetical protein